MAVAPAKITGSGRTTRLGPRPRPPEQAGIRGTGALGLYVLRGLAPRGKLRYSVEEEGTSGTGLSSASSALGWDNRVPHASRRRETPGRQLQGKDAVDSGQGNVCVHRAGQPDAHPWLCRCHLHPHRVRGDDTDSSVRRRRSPSLAECLPSPRGPAIVLKDDVTQARRNPAAWARPWLCYVSPV